VFLQTEGPGQLATGAVITFVFLLLNLTCQPFCTDGLNSLQSFSLISQFFTLFCGILIGFTANMDKMGSDAQEKEDSSVLGWTIVLLNSATLVFPLVRKIMTGKHIELMETFICVVRFPLTCYMNWCGGQKRRDARIARKRAERAARHEVEAELGLAACPLEVPSTLSAVFLEDRPVDAEPQSPALRDTEQVKMADLAAGVFNQPAPSGFVEDRSAQQIDIEIERVQREIAEIVDRLGITQLNQPAPQVNMADLAAGYK
jgi:hypothetical protein